MEAFHMTLDQVREAAEVHNYKAMELIYDGLSEDNRNPRSHVFRMGAYCIKYYIRCKSDYYTEYANLQKLEPFGFAPKLYYGSEEKHYIIMEFIEGTPLGMLSTPLSSDQKTQLETIYRHLDDLDIYYEKQDIHCLIEPSGKVRFIDFNI
jgi:hypothetical protein